MAATPLPLIEAIDPRIKAFETQAFSLAEELEWLDRLRGFHAPVAVVLHSARILEFFAWEAVARVGPRDLIQRRKDGLHLHDVLQQLKNDQHIPTLTYRLMNRLRELGNKARHVLRRLSAADAEQGFGIALRTLHWYFCEFRKKPAIKCLTIHNQPFESLLPGHVATLLAALDSSFIDAQGFVADLGLNQPNCPLLLSPVLASVLVEKLLDGSHWLEGQQVLTAALQQFPHDVRLRQLQGLLWSRTGYLREARDYLESIDATNSAADDETLGILAGVYKRCAEADPSQRRQLLQASHHKYNRGWKQSQLTNTYLGINAAATAMWLGQTDKADSIARAIRELLENRRDSLAQNADGSRWYLNCWDQLTLAEAYLLLRQWDEAREAYRTARERFPENTWAHKVARDQAIQNLLALGEPALIAAICPE